MAVRGEAPGHIDGCALLDVAEDLLVARFIAYDQQAAASFLHRFERLVIGGDAGGTGPRKVQLLQFRGDFEGAGRAVIERIVVEENLFEAGEIFEHILALRGDILRGTQAPAVTGMGLRPEAEGTHGGASARGVEGDVRIQQERNVVAFEIKIAFVDFRYPRKLVEILDDRAFGIMNVLAVLAIADARQFAERSAFGVGDDLVIEFAANDEIDSGGRVQDFIRLNGNRRSNKADLHL